MAAALLGKWISFLAIALLLYTCCYAFRIRDAPAQPPPAGEHAAHRSTCGSIFGRCTEKTAAGATSTLRKWHEIAAPRAPAARKPPVEVTSLGDEEPATGPRTPRRGRAGYAREDFATGPARSTAARTAEVDDDGDDDDEAVVEIEEESEEVEPSEEQDPGDSGVESEEEQADDGDDDEEDDEDGDGEEEDEDDEEEVERQWSFRKTAKLVKSVKEKDEKEKDDDEKGEPRKKAALGKDMKMIETDHAILKKREKIQVSDKEKEDLREDEEEDEDEDDEEDDEEDEDEDDEEEEEEVPPTPPPRKLEKVRHADKEKPKPVEAPPSKITDEPKLEVKKPVVTQRPEQVTKKPIEAAKKTPESAKKPSEVSKKSAEPAKSVSELPKKSPETKKSSETTKKSPEVTQKSEDTKESVQSAKKTADSPRKPESSKTSKSEPETTKKPAPKPEEKVKPSGKPVKPVQAAAKEAARQAEKPKVKTVDAKPAPAKAAEVARSGKKESKPTTKKGGDAPITLAELNEAILHVPTFVPNFTAVGNLECQQHGKIFLRQLRGYRLWALQMLDSNAKVPSGLLRGNVNQFGDFDQCLGVIAHVKVDDKTIRVQGKYCLASIDLHASHPDMKFPVNLMQSRAFLRGSMRDSGHFAPKFTTVNWALCLPAACSSEDAESVLREALSEYNVTAGIRFSADVNPEMCYVKSKARIYSKETIGVLYFYAMVVCLVLVATIRDYLVVPHGKGNYSERIIMSFSLRRTVKTLLNAESREADITCIHGIRALVTCALYIAHQVIPLAHLPYANRITLTEIANNPVSSVLRASMVYTDACLLLSGVLTAYNMANENTTRGEIRWFCRFIARYIRLTPALLVIVFWYAFVMEHTGSGPLWNSVIMPNVELCKNNAWTNLLYIQNFFPFEQMCATHTHQLALDMQLSLLAPMLVFFLQCKVIIGILLISFVVLLSATLRYIATVNNYLSLVIFHGMSLRQLYKTASLSYALPLHRATPYILGVGLGVLLHHTGKNVRIHKVFVILGWLIAMALGSWSLFSPWRLARRDYVYDVEEMASYAVVSPVSWALALCWLIFACFTGNGGTVNRFLSSYWLVVFSRISYAVYLTQFAVFFYNVGTTRYSAEFQLHRAIDPLEAITVIAVSVALTLLFDFPMQEVKNVIMESTDNRAVGGSADDKSTVGVKEELGGSVKSEGTGERVQEKDGTVFEGDSKPGKQVGEHPAEEQLSKKPDGARRTLISHDSVEPDPMPAWDWIRTPSGRLSREDSDYGERGRISRSSQYSNESDEEALEFLRIQQEREEAARRGRRSLSRGLDSRRLVPQESEEGTEYARRWEEEGELLKRPELRASRERSVTRDPEDYRSWEFINKERSSSGVQDARDTSRPEEYDSVPRQTRPPLSRAAVVRRAVSSESEDDAVQRRKTERKVLPGEPRISDEEEWESELRIRRKQFMEKLAMAQPDSVEEEDSSTPRRRSSAAGRIALLKDPSPDDNMDSWTVSIGPRIGQMGSSQEASEPEEEIAYARRREYRERAPPSREDTHSEEEGTWDSSKRRSYTSGSQVTSLEEDEDEEISNFNFVLTKDSKRISVHDLSQLATDEADLSDSGWNVVKKEAADAAPKGATLGLFKRESIIKSQASEEDPEYLLPERPKLVQQEREHPFKKAWQMQKSRSEEDGSAAYAIKDPKENQSEAKSAEQDPSSVRRESSGEQSEDVGSVADDESESATLSQSRSISTDTEGNRTSSKSDETEPISTEQSGSAEEKGNSRSDADEESVSFSWPSEEEQFETYKMSMRRMSEEVEWEPEET